MRIVQLSCFTILASLVACAPSAHADVVFSDGTFSTSVWVNETVIVGTGGTVAVSQQATGNPGFARRIDLTTGNAIGDTTWAFSRFGNNLATRYEPATQGSIQSISWTIDARFVTGTFFGSGQTVALGLRQNNINYYADIDVTTSSGQWITINGTGLTASSFQRLDGLAGTPDLTASGAPIRFGFVSGNSNGGSPFSTSVDYDNWEVSVVVPAPASMVVASVGLVTLVRRRRS